MSLSTLRVLIPGIAAVMLSACSPPPADEASLRAAVDLLEQTGEERRVDDFMELIADDFAGPPEASDKRALERWLRMVALRSQSIGVTRTSTTVQMFDRRATVKVNMLVSADAGGLLPEARQMEVESGWRNDGGGWQVIHARWQ